MRLKHMPSQRAVNVRSRGTGILTGRRLRERVWIQIGAEHQAGCLRELAASGTKPSRWRGYVVADEGTFAIARDSVPIAPKGKRESVSQCLAAVVSAAFPVWAQ